MPQGCHSQQRPPGCNHRAGVSRPPPATPLPGSDPCPRMVCLQASARAEGPALPASAAMNAQPLSCTTSWLRRASRRTIASPASVTIVHYLPRSRHGTARPVRAAVTVTPLPSAVSGAVSGDAGVAAEPDGITGQTLSWPGGLRLPATGQRAAWFWLATGQVVPIGGLPPQRSGYEFIRAAGGWAVQAGPGAQAACGSCAGPRHAVYFLADGGRSVTRAGLADAVAPGAAGALWLTSYSPDADPRTAAGIAREVSIAGRPLGPQIRLPAGYLIEQGTGRGLLLAPVAQRPGTMADMLWDPAARQPSRTFEGVIAASATQIAWAPPCAARCRGRC